MQSAQATLLLAMLYMCVWILPRVASNGWFHLVECFCRTMTLDGHEGDQMGKGVNGGLPEGTDNVGDPSERAVTSTRNNRVRFGVGSAGQMLLYSGVSVAIVFFYVDVRGLPAWWVGGVLMFYGLYNAVNDPVMGYISDRTRSKWGRRRPYVLFLGPILSLSFIFVFLPSDLGIDGRVWNSMSGEMLHFALVLFFFDLMYTVVTLPYTSWYAESTEDPVERSETTALMTMFALLGIGMAYSGTFPLANRMGWFGMAVVFGVSSTVFFVIAGCSGLPELRGHMVEVEGFITSLREALGFRPFRVYTVVWFLTSFAQLMLTASLPFYFKYVLKSSEDFSGYIMGAALVVAACLLLPMHKYASKNPPKSVMTIGLLGLVPGLLVLLVVSDKWFAFLAIPAFGLGLAGVGMASNLLVAEIIEVDAIRRGSSSREGLFTGVNTFIARLAIAMQGFMIAIVFECVDYVPDAESQTNTVLVAIRAMTALIPALSAGLAVFVLKYYHVERNRQG